MPQTLDATAKQFGTPCYVYDEATLAQNAEQLLGIPYPNKTVYAASMANDNPVLLDVSRRSGLGIFVNSMKHLAVGARSGFTPEKIIYTTTGLSESDLRFLVECGVTINLDSVAQVEAYGELNPGGAVGVRLNID